MTNSFVYVANWKMYLCPDEEIKIANSKYNDFLSLSQNKKNKIILCPSYLSLFAFSKMFETTNLYIASQNCSIHKNGSFTGQISADCLNKIGIKYCLIGHSECRIYLKETNKEISKKFLQLIYNNISPIICIGENEQEYKENLTIQVIEEQINCIFSLIKKSIKIPKTLPIYIAYEPIWSIGTGNIANFKHLTTIFDWLFEKIKKINNIVTIKLLYGGSVNSDNASFLKKLNNLNGFLIGSSSIDFQEFKKIVELET